MTTRNKTLLALLAIFILQVFLVGCGSGNGDAKAGAGTKTESLVGDWHQIGTGIPSTTMTATITEGAIQITLSMGDTSGIYWLGTFTDWNTSNSFTTISLGDQDAMALDIFASVDTVKTFTYENGDLSYEFSILGNTTTVHLSK